MKLVLTLYNYKLKYYIMEQVLKVIELIGRNKFRKLRCKAECNCGSIIEADYHKIINGKQKECFTCSRKRIAANKIKYYPKEGETYNSWTILKLYRSKNNRVYAEAQCKCGTTSSQAMTALLRSESCRNCKGVRLRGKIGHSRKGYQGISGTYWNAITRGAKARGRVFNVSIEYCWELFQKQNGKCALSGLDITLGFSAIDGEQTASIDRIDNSKDYIEGNIQWVHKDINKSKHAFTQERFIELCKAVASIN